MANSIKTDEKAASSHTLFSSDEAALLLKTLKGTAEVGALSAQSQDVPPDSPPVGNRIL